MNLAELVIISISLAMDAFAVSLCKSLATKHVTIQKTLTISLLFGFFQFLMPVIGYFLGANFLLFIQQYDHWVAFILLAVIGFNMIKESRDCENGDDNYALVALLPLAIATSIDALAIGISFALLQVNIWLASLLIGIITTLICIIGVTLGKILGTRFQSFAQAFGGATLMLLGLKILLEHTHIL
ncbi:MAG: manganese efflux pump MntP family protein [Erysipelotrichaceae bacterium]|jgi:putative Mn2+ efflux pump MntP|nr:manganese efflux pump MntP family protein [Erysipelotrichaceae bacterium]